MHTEVQRVQNRGCVHLTSTLFSWNAVLKLKIAAVVLSAAVSLAVTEIFEITFEWCELVENCHHDHTLITRSQNICIKNSGQVTEWYYLTDPLIRISESLLSALWWDAVITARVSSVRIKRLCCWYKMFQSFGWKSNPEGQMTLCIMYVDPNHGTLIQRVAWIELQKINERPVQMTGCLMSDLMLPVTWGPRCPVTDTEWNLAGVGSQWINERTGKRTPLLWGRAGRRWLHWSGRNL